MDQLLAQCYEGIAIIQRMQAISVPGNAQQPVRDILASRLRLLADDLEGT